MDSHPLFQPFRLKSLELKNRLVMAPMTRSFSPGGAVMCLSRLPDPEFPPWGRKIGLTTLY